MAILPAITLEKYHNEYNQPSPTMLSEALKSQHHLAYYLHHKGAMKPSDEYNFGTLIHEYIESNFEFPKQYEEMPELYQRATGVFKAGDPKLDDDGDPKFTYICKTDPDKSLTPANSKKAKIVIAGLSQCEEARNMFSKGKLIVEQSMTGVIGGVECKCRPDILLEFKDKIVVVELKTTRHGLINMESFARDFFDFDYDMQCCFEAEITQQNYPEKHVEVVVLAVSSDMPSGAAIFEMPETLIKTGKDKIACALETWRAEQEHPAKEFYFVGRREITPSFKALNYLVERGIE